jgi:hypothetical protein
MTRKKEGRRPKARPVTLSAGGVRSPLMRLMTTCPRLIFMMNTPSMLIYQRRKGP